MTPADWHYLANRIEEAFNEHVRPQDQTPAREVRSQALQVGADLLGAATGSSLDCNQACGTGRCNSQAPSTLIRIGMDVFVEVTA